MNAGLGSLRMVHVLEVHGRLTISGKGRKYFTWPPYPDTRGREGSSTVGLGKMGARSSERVKPSW